MKFLQQIHLLSELASCEADRTIPVNVLCRQGNWNIETLQNKILEGYPLHHVLLYIASGYKNLSTKTKQKFVLRSSSRMSYLLISYNYSSRTVVVEL
jgi:hypothetical protein